jgi:hypothetical protein
MRTRAWLGLLVAGAVAWGAGLVAGPFAPLAAGVVAGAVAPRRGSFIYPALGAFAAWALWFAVAAASSPLLPLGGILARVMGLPSLHGVMLPLLACVLAGVVAGLAAAGVAAIARA